MAPPPQAAIKAPSGARKPKTFTELRRSSVSPPNVVRIITHGGAKRAHHRAKLDQQVGRSPEAVTANGFMPGNVPIKPRGNAHGSNHVGPDQPWHGFRP